MDYSIRPIKKEEITLLSDFLYESIYQPEGEKPLPRTIIQEAPLWVYINNFGEQQGDVCLVTESEGKIIGAIWARHIHACGFVDDRTPEIALSIYPEYRNHGIGTQMLREMMSFLKERGYEDVSLCVIKGNIAINMYLRLGFEVVREDDTEYVMACKLL